MIYLSHAFTCSFFILEHANIHDLVKRRGRLQMDYGDRVKNVTTIIIIVFDQKCFPLSSWVKD